MHIDSALDAIKKGLKYWNNWYSKNQSKDISFRNANLKNLDLDPHSSAIRDQNLSRANLQNIDFSFADLSNSSLYGANLENSNFESANLQNVSFWRANCKNANFQHSNLKNSKFHKAKIDFANFSNADLTGADFTILSSKGVKLKNAIITNIEIEGLTPTVSGPWNVDPYQFIEVADFVEVSQESQIVVYNYIKAVLTDLANINKSDIIDTEAYNQLLNKTKALYKIYDETNDTQALISVVNKLNIELIEYIKKNPSQLYKIHWRTFEELIAEILSSFGWQVELTAPTKDNGYDIFAIYKDDSGIRHNWIVECKKYDKENKVGVEVVRSLYGVKTDLRVGNALLATTSFFTKGVADFQASHYDFETKDFNGIVDWLNNYKLNPGGKLYIENNKLRK